MKSKLRSMHLSICSKISNYRLLINSFSIKLLLQCIDEVKTTGCSKSHCAKVWAYCLAPGHLIRKTSLGMFQKSNSFEKYTTFSETLLKKLHTNFGLAGNVCRWFQSYLDGRSFSVIINKSRSGYCILKIRVPQGSILGPILIILYTKELHYIANEHGFNIHLYAGDTQMYMEFNHLF